MSWADAPGASIGAANYLSDGRPPHFETCMLLWPIQNGSEVEAHLWTGHEDLTLSIDGVSRTLSGTKGALGIENVTHAEGTDIRTLQASLFGLTPQALDIIRAYEPARARVEVHQLLFTQGMEYLGNDREFRGNIDQIDHSLGVKGGDATLTAVLVSAMRRGTVTTTRKKSNESYLLRGGDTSMAYASLKDVDADPWG